MTARRQQCTRLNILGRISAEMRMPNDGEGSRPFADARPGWLKQVTPALSSRRKRSVCLPSRGKHRPDKEGKKEQKDRAVLEAVSGNK